MRAVRVLVAIVLVMPFAHALPSVLPLPEPQPPVADFVYADPLPRQVVNFTSTSTDRDGMIILLEWTFERGNVTLLPTTGERVEHVFAEPGDYRVSLTATDSSLFVTNITRIVSVPNTPPIVVLNVTPSPVFRGWPVLFEDLSYDEDGDAIIESEWTIGSGVVLQGRNVTHAFSNLGLYPVELRVRDARGTDAFAMTYVRVLNRPPVLSASYAPREPFTGDVVTFTATGVDPDVADGPVTFDWRFSDGVRFSGETITRTFQAEGNYSVALIGRDMDGGISTPWVAGLHVRT